MTICCNSIEQTLRYNTIILTSNYHVSLISNLSLVKFLSFLKPLVSTYFRMKQVSHKNLLWCKNYKVRVKYHQPVIIEQIKTLSSLSQTQTKCNSIDKTHILYVLVIEFVNISMNPSSLSIWQFCHKTSQTHNTTTQWNKNYPSKSKKKTTKQSS